MSDNSYDGATAVGNNDAGAAAGPSMFTSATKSGFRPSKAAFVSPSNELATVGNAEDLPFVDSSAYLSVKRPFLVPTGKGGVREALFTLNQEMVQAGHVPLISKKKPGKIIGREVNPGSFGLYEYGSQPQLLMEPGNYPGLPFANWIGCTYFGTFDLSTNFPPRDVGMGSGKSQKLDKLGLSIVQVSQNQAAVCMDPQNRVFVVADGGFVAVATTGAYRTLGLVDMTHLKTAVRDKYTQQVLGHMQQVALPGGYVAATFLDIPANNVAILQRKDELYMLGAGQHYLTTASVTIRGMFTKGEVQQELEVDSLYTRDQVPVWLRMYLRYELQNPLALAKHGYETPFDSLQDKTRSILTQILAHLDYSAMTRSRNAAPDTVGDHHDDHQDDDVNSVFVSAVRTQATDELKVIAAEYGILLQDLAIIDRKFKGEVAMKMDQLTTRALEAQVESANLDRENANRRLKLVGDARVLELQNTMKRATAETDASNVIAAAKARAEAMTIEAQAKATAIKLTAEADADAIRIKARADAEISHEFAQAQAKSRIEVERTRAYGDKTVFAPIEALNNGIMGGFGGQQQQSRRQ